MSINEHDPGDDITLAPLEFDDNVLDEWIEGGGISKSLVVMYGKPHLAAEYMKVEDDLKLAVAKAGEEGDELGGGDVGKLKARREQIYAEWEASRSRWTVRAFTDALVDEADEATTKALGPAPTPPREVSKDSPKSKRDEYAEKHAKYEKADKAWADHSRAELVMRLVEHIEFADGRRARITRPEQVLRMRETFGETQIMKIIEAAQLSRMFTPELKAPFSLGTSRSEQT